MSVICGIRGRKAESLIHTSVGQRPTYRRTTYLRLKALNIFGRLAIGCSMVCKAFSLDDFCASLRRALPYASMSCPFRAVVVVCKAFSLDDFFVSLRRALPYASMSCPFRAWLV